MGVMRKMRQGTELDDLMADGNMGLIRAVEGFDPDRGFKFQTYATTVVRGAIYNGLRRMDWVPERTRARARLLQQTRDRITSETGEEPSDEALAEEMKISTDEVYELVASMGAVYLLSLDQPLVSDDPDASISDVVEDEEPSPLQEVEFGEERDALRNAIRQLDEREQMIITLHYFEGVTFEAVSRQLGVSKQRVSQMHSRAVKRLRDALGDEALSSEAIQGFTFDSQA